MMQSQIATVCACVGVINTQYLFRSPLSPLEFTLTCFDNQATNAKQHIKCSTDIRLLFFNMRLTYK